MTVVTLDDRQQTLLSKLVHFVENGYLPEPFAPIPTGAARYVFYLFGAPNFHIKWLSDLDVLCMAGYLEHSWNRMSTAKLFKLTKAGFKLGKSLSDKRQFEQQKETFSRPATRLRPHHSAMKQALTTVLSGVRLGDAVANLNEVKLEFGTLQPNVATVTNEIATIGELLIMELAEADVKRGKQISAVLSIYADWCSRIYSK